MGADLPLVADLRLDNREELAVTLGLGAARNAEFRRDDLLRSPEGVSSRVRASAMSASGFAGRQMT